MRARTAVPGTIAGLAVLAVTPRERVIAYETDELGNPVRITTRDGKGRLISVQSLDYRYIER